MKTNINPLNVLVAAAFFWSLFISSPHCQAQPTSLRDEISGQTIDSTATKVIVLIHGWNPENTTDKYSSSNPEWFSLVTALKSKLAGSDWKLITYHWEQQGTISPSIGANTGDVWNHLLINDFFGYGNATVAAVHAEQQGASMSSLLNSQAPGLRKVHFIAHSAGSWAAREAMRLLLNANATVVCQMTLLDPFIPDASSLVGTTTGLSTSKMSATTGLPGNSRIQRLEDYYAEDIIDQCNTPTISTPGVEFTWRAGDKNLRVDWGDSGFPGLSLWYDCHSGPVQFYADTVRFVDFAPAYGGLQSPDFDLDDIGWKKSLFYQEQQLRASITSISPATLPTSSSPQLITINGTNFKPSGDPNASSLIFYDPANTAYPRTPINVTTTSMQYNINVQSGVGTWKVKVVNGGVESLPFSFTVTSSGAQLTGLSISGPATVAENNIGQFTATAYFSDGSSSTVTSSTSWSENSSATTISSSGLLSAGSVSSDTAVTVSASYTLNGITKSTSANVTVVNSGSGGGTTTVHPLVNGTFESGASPWSPSGYADIVALSYPHLGSWYAYLCNANNAAGSFAQFFPIPAGTTAASIQFYLNVVSQETAVFTAYDTMKVDLVTANEQYVGTIAQFSNLDKGGNVNGSYTLKNYNIMSLISAYKGQSLFLVFSGQTDADYSTIFRIDNVDITLTVNNPVSLTGLSIRGPSSIPEGRGDTFWADAIFSDGTTQQISPNSWSENSSVTTISSDGFLAAESVNLDTPVTVTASYTFSGVTQQATKSVTIVDTNATHTLSSLAISGPSSMNENSSGQFTATAIFADGTSQTVMPTWSENSSATTISSGGLLNAGGVGSDTTVTVSASYMTGGITRNANQDVLIINVPTPPTLASLTISGPNSLNENTTAQYYATAAFSDGASQSVTPTWSEDSTATSIAMSGLLNAGEVASDTSVTISASYTVGGITRNAQKGVTVVNTTGLPAYTLTVNAVNGTVARNPNQASYTSGSQVVLTASPANGYIFDTWSGDAIGGQNPITVTMTANKNITANFTLAPISSNQPYEAKWALALNTLRVYASAPAQNGGMVLFGTFTGTTTAGGQSLTANGAPSDFYGVKLNASNQVVWVRQYGGPNEEDVESCAQHPEGGWVIAGTFRNTGNIGGVSLVSVGNRDAYLARLDEAGNVLWAKRGGGSSIDYGEFTGVDGAGNCFLFGKFTSSATFTGGGVTLSAIGTRFDIFVAKYSASGDFLWAKSGGGPEYDDLYSASVDTAGNAYLGGIFEIQTTFGPYTVVNSGSPSDWDGFLSKLNSNGDVLWLKKFGQSSADSSTDSIDFIAPAADGTCFFGGQYELPMLVDGQALPGQTSLWTAFVGKIGSSGTVEWLRGIPTTTIPDMGVYFSFSRAERGLQSSDGGLIVGGTYEGKLTFGSTVSTNANAQEYLYFAKFDPAGTAQWAISSDSPGFGYMHYLGPANGERIRFAARISQPVGLPGIPTITATSDDTVLVELGPPEIIIPPVISMIMAGDKIVLTWPSTASGFVLESATNLPPISWTSNLTVPTTIGGNFTVTNTITNETKFFRLRK